MPCRKLQLEMPSFLRSGRIFSDNDRRTRLVGFVDDDTFKKGKVVYGLCVLSPLD